MSNSKTKRGYTVGEKVGPWIILEKLNEKDNIGRFLFLVENTITGIKKKYSSNYLGNIQRNKNFKFVGHPNIHGTNPTKFYKVALTDKNINLIIDLAKNEPGVNSKDCIQIKIPLKK